MECSSAIASSTATLPHDEQSSSQVALRDLFDGWTEQQQRIFSNAVRQMEREPRRSRQVMIFRLVLWEGRPPLQVAYDHGLSRECVLMGRLRAARYLREWCGPWVL